MTKALVTGATGFVGSAVARELKRHGWALRLLVRSKADRRNLDGLDAECVVGDLSDADRLAAVAAGCDAVFHIAADYRLWAPDPAPLYAANVEGTRNVLRAAARAGVGRVVYTSSVATLGIPRDGSPGDENTPVTLADMIGHYKRSKFLAEQVARKAATGGLDVVIVNPSTPIGPRDRRPTPTGRIVLDAAAGRMPAYVDTGLNVVHVEDVAIGHRLAFERGRAGERYVLGGENLTLAQILAEIAAIVGRKPPKIRLPHGLVLPIAYLAQGVARLTGGTPIATVEEVRMARKRMFFSSEKARRDLGYAPRPARQALEDAVRWYRENGYL